MGALIPAAISQIASVTDTLNAVNQDVACDSTSGLVCVVSDYQSAYAQNPATRKACFSIIDGASGNIIVAKQTIATTAMNPKVFFFGGYFFILYYDSVAYQFDYVLVSPATPSSVSSPQGILIGGASNHLFDACISNGALLVAGYSGSAINVCAITAPGTFSTVVATFSENASAAISIFADSVNQNIWVAYADSSGNIKWLVLNSDYTTHFSPGYVCATAGNIRNLTGWASNGSGQLFAESYPSTLNPQTAYVSSWALTRAGGIGPRVTLAYGHGLVSKVFSWQGNYSLIIVRGSTLQKKYVAITAAGEVFATFLAGTAGGFTNAAQGVQWAGSTLAEVVPLGSNFLFAAIVATVQTGTGAYAPILAQSNLALYELSAPRKIYSLEAAETLLFSGAQPKIYDGLNVVEQGFHYWPEVVTVAATLLGNPGGVFQCPAGAPSGVYTVYAVYEWVDNNGLIHRSAPSFYNGPTGIEGYATIPPGNSANSLVVTIDTLPFTDKKNVMIRLYVSVANGAENYFNTAFQIANDPTQATVQITVSALPNTTGPNLYTYGGVVSDKPLPAVDFVARYKSRVLAIPSEARTQFWFSQEIIPSAVSEPGTPIEFSDQLTWNISDLGGTLTGLFQLDDKLILQKGDLSFVMNGEGPDLTGAQNDFPDPQLIASDSGLINPASLVMTPMGLIYQSKRGFYLLDRSLGVQYIGAEVEAFANSTVIAASLLPRYNIVAIFLSTGTVLCYDYLAKSWSQWSGFSLTDAALIGDLITLVGSNGVISQETPFAFVDAPGIGISMGITTGWISLSGIQGYQRAYSLYVLGTYKSPHTLNVSIAYDYASSASQLTAIPIASDPGLYEFRVPLAQQKCTALKISISDSPTSPYGEGFSLSNISLRVGIKKGASKLGAANTFS
jgi:hypothetical protein